MMKKSRLIMKGGLLDYAEVQGARKPKAEANYAKLSLLSKLWRTI